VKGKKTRKSIFAKDMKGTKRKKKNLETPKPKTATARIHRRPAQRTPEGRGIAKNSRLQIKRREGGAKPAGEDFKEKTDGHGRQEQNGKGSRFRGTESKGTNAWTAEPRGRACEGRSEGEKIPNEPTKKRGRLRKGNHLG